jgi:V/A-type H+-transporting ATPase subunit E
MSIETITAKILSDATDYAEEITQKAKAEAASITAEAQKEAIEIKKLSAERAAEQALTLRHRRTAVAELEARKIRLDAKQMAVANTIDSAIEHLANMQTDEYIDFLAKKIAETGIKDGQVVLNASDKAAIGEKLLEEANKLLAYGRLTLAVQTMNAKGGFILKSGSIEFNSCLETMINSLKEDVTLDVVEALFPNNEDRYEKI